jgi:hypothetical protein
LPFYINISAYDIFTDASDVGAAGFIKNSHLIMFKTWLKLEAGKSSTWREIKAVELCLLPYLPFKIMLAAF